jgi:hypothetical protein
MAEGSAAAVARFAAIRAERARDLAAARATHAAALGAAQRAGAQVQPLAVTVAATPRPDPDPGWLEPAPCSAAQVSPARPDDEDLGQRSWLH